METSALTGECVDEVFLKCASSIVQKIENGVIDIQSMMASQSGNSATTTATGTVDMEQKSGGCAC